ncbi:tudor domain-containing protein 7B-like [Arapaima gigas]
MGYTGRGTMHLSTGGRPAGHGDFRQSEGKVTGPQNKPGSIHSRKPQTSFEKWEFSLSTRLTDMTSPVGTLVLRISSPCPGAASLSFHLGKVIDVVNQQGHCRAGKARSCAGIPVTESENMSPHCCWCFELLESIQADGSDTESLETGRASGKGTAQIRCQGSTVLFFSCLFSMLC